MSMAQGMNDEMQRRLGRLSRRQLVRGVGVAGLGLLAGCGVGAPQREPPAGVTRARLELPVSPTPPADNEVSEGKSPARDRLPTDILGGHDAPNPGGSRNIGQLVADLRALGMKTAVCIDPAPAIVDALGQAGVRLIVRLVQENNVFDKRNILWTLDKLAGVPGVSIVPFNEPNLEGLDVSPEEHIRGHFLPAARVILPRIAPDGGTLLLTPLACYAPYQGVDELAGYRRMLVALRDELASGDGWMVSHLAIGAHAYSYHLSDDRLWPRVEQIAAISREVLGVSLPIEITEAGLNIDYEGQYSDEEIAAETVRLLGLPIPESLRGVVRSFCLWIVANYAQRDQAHQQLGDERKEQQKELDRFEVAALRRLDGVTPTYQAIAKLAAAAPVQ
jgi:hypothetical protein